MSQPPLQMRLEELHRLQRSLDRRIRRDRDAPKNLPPKARNRHVGNCFVVTLSARNGFAGCSDQMPLSGKLSMLTACTRSLLVLPKERRRMPLTPLHLALGVNGSDLSMDLIRKACAQAVKEQQDLEWKSSSAPHCPSGQGRRTR